MKNTMVELVDELQKLSDTNIKDKLIDLAKTGAFHDYRSKATCGKMYFLECAQWCYKNEMPKQDIDIIKKLEHEIKEGIYDEPYTKKDSEIVLEECRNDPNINEKDKAFFMKAMAWRGDEKDKFGKDFFK